MHSHFTWRRDRQPWVCTCWHAETVEQSFTLPSLGVGLQTTWSTGQCLSWSDHLINGPVPELIRPPDQRASAWADQTTWSTGQCLSWSDHLINGPVPELIRPPDQQASAWADQTTWSTGQCLSWSDHLINRPVPELIRPPDQRASAWADQTTWSTGQCLSWSDHLINRPVPELIRHKLLLSGAFLIAELSADPKREVRHAAGGGSPPERGLQRPGGGDTLWGHLRTPHCSGYAWLEPWNGLFIVILEAGGWGGVCLSIL